MIKIYELIILIILFSFIIYSNIDTYFLSNNTENTKVNDSNITMNDINCYENCDNPNINDTDPCLCKRQYKDQINKVEKPTCDIKKSNDSFIISKSDISSNRLNNEIKFNELILSAFNEHFYAKIMEITQISYMNYIHTNKNLINTHNTPQYLFFESIEFIKRGDYNKAKSLLEDFIRTPIYYENNKCNFDVGFFRYEGCCQYDLDWIHDRSHQSYKLSKIMLNILNDITEQNINIFSSLDSLKTIDINSNTFNLIDNIIFAFTHSLINSKKDNDFINQLITYQNTLFDSKNDILLDSFDNVFKGTINNYYLSTQIDILVYIKILEANKLVDSINNNDSNNSLVNIETLIRFGYLQNKYFGKIDSNISKLIINNKNNIQNLYQSCDKYLILDNTQNNSTEDYFGITFDNQSEQHLNIKYDDCINDLNKKNNLKRSIDLTDHWMDIVNLNKLNSNNSDSLDFFINIYQNIDYNYFVNSIDMLDNNNFYPIFKADSKEYYENITLDKILYDSKDKYYESNYIYDKSKKYKLYKNDLYIIDIFNNLLYLNSPSGFFSLKNILNEIHLAESNHSSFNQYDIEYGQSLLEKSINLWQNIKSIEK